MLFVPPKLKQGLSSYLMANSSARVASPRQDFGNKSGMATVKGAVQMWETDFGVIRIYPSRNMPTDEVLLLNPEHWAISYLTGFTVKSLPDGADDRQRVLTVDFAVVSKNEAASGCITAITDTDAVVA